MWVQDKYNNRRITRAYNYSINQNYNKIENLIGYYECHHVWATCLLDSILSRHA